METTALGDSAQMNIQGSGRGVPGRPWLPEVTSMGVLRTESSGEDTPRPGPFTHTIGSLPPPLYRRQRPRGGGLPTRVQRMNVNPRGSGWTWGSSLQPDTKDEWP